jgi:hypothetical protein
MNPGVSPHLLWRTRGLVNLGGGPAPRLPRGKRQDVRLAFGHPIRGHAKTLLRDH